MASKLIVSTREAEKRYALLPPDLQGAFTKNLLPVTEALAQKYHLTQSQGMALVEETSFVLLGFTERQDFPDLLSERLDIDPPTALQIAGEADATLCTPLQDSISKMAALNTPEGASAGGEDDSNLPVAPSAHHILNVLKNLPPRDAQSGVQ